MNGGRFCGLTVVALVGVTALSGDVFVARMAQDHLLMMSYPRDISFVAK